MTVEDLKIFLNKLPPEMDSCDVFADTAWIGTGILWKTQKRARIKFSEYLTFASDYRFVLSKYFSIINASSNCFDLDRGTNTVDSNY